jgi:predicted negative regulator of RcsB-dependent stress response
MTTEKKKSGFKRKAAAATAVVLALAITLGGTYMWYDYTQHKTNEASNTQSRYQARLVEDFQEKDDWTINDGALTKEIRVTNTGLPDSDFAPVYARIQLKEYLELAPMLVEKTPDRYMIDTSGNYIVFDTEQEALDAYPDAPAVVELTDAVSGREGWFVQTKAHDPNGQYGDYVITTYGPGEIQHIVGDVRADTDAAKDEKHDVAANDQTSERNGECDYPARDWTDLKGTNLIADEGTVYTDGKFVDDSVLPNETAGYIRWLLDNNYIITLTDWVAGGAQPIAKWIIDDRALSQNGGLDGARVADAWIYWGDAIAPGESTGNFMNAVELKVQPDGSFYYAVHVEMEALSRDELTGETAKWTDAPEKIIEAFTGKMDAFATVVDAQNYRLTTAQTDDTADWIAVAKKTIDEQDYFLIVRTAVTESVSFDADTPFMNNYNSAESQLKTTIDSWYSTFASTNASSVLVTKAVTHNALTALGENYTHGYNGAYKGFSLPTATPASAGAAGTAFPLSSDEAARYMSKYWNNAVADPRYNTSDGTAGGPALTAYTNWEALSDGSTTRSWLRSPVASDSSGAAILLAEGVVDYYGVSYPYGARPALWVTSDIFTN